MDLAPIAHAVSMRGVVAPAAGVAAQPALSLGPVAGGLPPGYLMPAPTATPVWPGATPPPHKRKGDGSFSRPKGRAPKGKEWDGAKGEWSEDALLGGEPKEKKHRAVAGNAHVDVSTGATVCAGKTTKFPAKLGDLVGRQIAKLFKNVVSEELEWHVGTIHSLIAREHDLAVWRLPAPKKGSQTWVRIDWRGDPTKRVSHMLLDPSTFPFCMEDAPPHDPALRTKWACLLDPTTFGYTSKGTEKMLRQGIWKLVDRPEDDRAAAAAADRAPIHPHPPLAPPLVMPSYGAPPPPPPTIAVAGAPAAYRGAPGAAPPY